MELGEAPNLSPRIDALHESLHLCRNELNDEVPMVLVTYEQLTGTR